LQRRFTGPSPEALDSHREIRDTEMMLVVDPDVGQQDPIAARLAGMANHAAEPQIEGFMKRHAGNASPS
jgi:hypothetical protein